MSFPSTFLDLQNAVRNEIRTDATLDTQKVKDWINQTYAAVAVKTEAYEVYGTALLTANSSTYTLPAAVLRIKTLAIQGAGSTGYGRPLEESSLEEILQRRANGGSPAVSSASATVYALLGLSQLELWPTPGAADTILFYYIALPTALNLDADVPVLQEPYASELLTYGAAARAASFLKDGDAVTLNRGLYDAALKEFRTHLLRRQGGHVRAIPIAGRAWWPRTPDIDVRYW